MTDPVDEADRERTVREELRATARRVQPYNFDLAVHLTDLADDYALPKDSHHD